MVSVNFQKIERNADLMKFLGRIDIRVPERTKGRTTDHTETWSICRLLATLQSASILSYPISLAHRDRPDFAIDAGNSSIGVEVTESIPQQLAEISALAEREFPNALIEMPMFGQSAPKRSVAELRRMLESTRLTSDGWAGDQPEREWAFFIRKTIETKIERFWKDGFSKFDTNWLLIYDNLPFDIHDLNAALRYLHNYMQGINVCFNRIYIEHERSIIEIEGASWKSYAINDLWQNR